MKRVLRSLLVAIVTVLVIAGVGCGHEIESPSLAPAPASIAAGQRGPATPDLLCVEKLTPVTLKGSGFTPMPSKTLEDTTRLILPKVELLRTKDVHGAAAADAAIVVPDDPTSPQTSHVRWTSAIEMGFDVTPEMKVVPGVYDIKVTNPDGTHDAVFSGAVAAFAKPVIKGISPDIICDADSDTTVTITGTELLQVGTVLPIVRVGTQNINATKIEGCTPLPGTYAENPVSVCTSISFVVAKGILPPGAYDVGVQNPAPADCDPTPPVKLTIVPPPAVAEIHEDLVCAAQTTQAMSAIGTGFLQIGTENGTVTVTGQVVGAGGATTVTKTYPVSPGGCAPVPGTFTEGAVSTCTTAKFDIPAGDLPAGAYQVVVKNPAPPSCISKEEVYFYVAPPPSFDAVGTVLACVAEGSPQVMIEGGSGTGDFLRLTDGATVTYPTVTVEGVDYKANAANGCSELKLPKGTFREGKVELCTSIAYTLPQGSLQTGIYDVKVTNPPPANCSATTQADLQIVPPPTVTSVTPPSVCQGGGDITLAGTNLIPTATVTFSDPTGAQPSFDGTNVKVNAGGTSLTTTIPGAAGNPGTVYDVSVIDPGGCKDPVPHKKLTITTGPVLYFVDPNVVYNGINTALTLYVTTITGGVAASTVTLTPQGGGAPIVYTPGDATHPLNAVPGHPNRAQIVLPANTPTGAYDVTFKDSLSCPGQLMGAVTVTGSTSISLKDVVPPFGGQATSTSITVFRDGAAPAPGDTVFRATPRAFLNKANAAPTDVAIPLASVAFVDDATLTAVVPKNTATGVYDLIVIDPSPGNEVGVRANAFTVTAAPPPTITSVTPASVVNAPGQNVVITGTNFRAGATAGITQCTTSTGAASPAPSGVTTGALSCSGPSCTLAATIDAGALAAGTVCLLRVTNTDGSFVDFSAIGVTNSSLNLSAPRAGTQLTVGRRALVGAAANATSAARFVYAIGGDDGTAATPFASVEAAAVDPFGAIKAWGLQRYDLGTPRSFAAGVTLGNYIYLCGGTDGTNALATCRRAMVLNPAEAPALQVADITLATNGLGAGFWYYKVAAVFGAGDPDNPGGESLPSDEIILQLPAFQTKKLVITLQWSPPVDALGAPLPNVTGYRVYRSAAVNGASGAEVLLADNVTGTTFIDDGAKTPGSATPLPIGSTGQWAALPNMSVARRGPAVTYAVDPASPNVSYVYAFYGLNAAGAANNTYEYLPVTTAANGHQTVGGGWTAGAGTTGSPRWQHGAWRVDATVFAPASPSTYIYIGGGLNAAGTGEGAVEAAVVNPGGGLGTLSAVKDFSVDIAGYGVCAANGQLFTFGGVGGGPSNKAKSAELESPQPKLRNNSWNDEGLSLIDPLYLMGSSVQSAFIFLLGGETSAGPPIVVTRNTETVVW